MNFSGILKRRAAIAVTEWRQTPSGLWERGPVNRFTNLVVDTGLDLYARAVQSNAVKTQMTYVALGSSATVAAAGDTLLGSEQFRKQVTDYTIGAAGEITTTVYIAPGEANAFSIEEFGWFAENATATANTGTLVARVAQSQTKNNQTALQIDRTDTFTA